MIKINIWKMIGCSVIAVVAVASSSFSFVDNKEDEWDFNDIGVIGTRPQYTMESAGEIEDGMMAMQGISRESEAEYGRLDSLWGGDNEELSASMDDDMYRLDLAMRESSDIMKTLKTQPADYLDGGQTVIPDDTRMSIDDFEFQKIEMGGTDKPDHIGREVIAGVDISIPVFSKAGNDNAEISSATMRVVDVLLKYGLEDRALCLIEDELSACKIN